MIKLGIQPDIDQKPKEAFEFASKNKFSHVEILMDHPYYCYENLSFAEILELKGSYDLDVLIHAPATTTNFISISEVFRKASYEELRRTLFFAEKCEAELITFHIGWNPGFITARGFVFQKDLYSKHNYSVLTTEMHSFLKTINNPSILALENTIEIDESLKAAIEFLLNNTDLSLTFDIGHYYVKEGHALFLKNFDRVKNVHLHDNNGIYDEHLALGKGKVDLSIIPKKYKGYLTLELRDKDAIIESKNYVEKVFGVFE